MLSYTFIVYALIAVVLTSVMTGVIGSYVVARRQVFISGGITHSSFAGLGLGFFLGQSPILYALIAAVISGMGVEMLSRDGRVREDSAIATIWSLGMAIGVLFTFLTPGYTPGLSAFLFGNILMVTAEYLWLMVAYLALLLPLVLLLYRPLLYVSFDPEYARTRGLPVDLYRYGMMLMVCIGIVLSIRAMGIMMLMSMLTLPQMTMSRLTARFHWIIIGSTLLSATAVTAALFVSYYYNLPTGAVAVFVLTIIYFATMAVQRLQRLTMTR